MLRDEETYLGSGERQGAVGGNAIHYSAIGNMLFVERYNQ